MKVSDWIAAFLHAQGVGHVFEVSGGMITHLLDSLHKDGRVKLVSVRHEQAAAFAAEAGARMTGRPGVAMATSGPGAANLLTGIGSCYFDSYPAVFITGQVNRHEQKGERSIRQLGFQETDIVSMAAPITKAAIRVESSAALPADMARAFTLALSGRPGPVLVDIPMDIQREDISAPQPGRIDPAPAPAADPAQVAKALAALDSAARPLILAGGGIASARCAGRLREFAQRVGVPVVNSLLAVDALPAGHALRAGLLGSYGNRWANLAVGESDTLLVLGSRLDIRQTGSEADFLTQGRRVIHVDCEPGEINNRVTGCETVVAHLRSFLDAALKQAADRGAPGARNAWLGRISELRRQWPDRGEVKGAFGINPNDFMHLLSKASSDAGAYLVDVGQHQMWAAQSLDLGPDQRFITSGGMGALGFALPAGVGAALADPRRPHVVVAGDGGMQFNIQELQTIVHHKLPLKIVVVDNRCHGMVRQFQQCYFDNRYPATLWGYSAPDFCKVAQAYGIAAQAVTKPEELDAGLAGLWADPQAPFLLQVNIDTFANLYPKIAFGRPLTEMEPFAQPLDMEGT